MSRPKPRGRPKEKMQSHKKGNTGTETAKQPSPGRPAVIILSTVLNGISAVLAFVYLTALVGPSVILLSLIYLWIAAYTYIQRPTAWMLSLIFNGGMVVFYALVFTFLPAIVNGVTVLILATSDMRRALGRA
ncbi:MAG: hypothetical protein ACP6IT_07750 [Candidatus Thorarchaeota archaeon]